jgi:hypothetical protein
VPEIAVLASLIGELLNKPCGRGSAFIENGLVLAARLAPAMSWRTLHEHTAQPLPKLTRHLGTVRGLFRQIETARNFEDRLKHSAL